MQTIEQVFGNKKIVPIINLSDVKVILKITELLVLHGISVIEVRVNSKASFDAIKLIRSEFPNVSVGAAGIIDAADFLNASLAGAQFISSPGATLEIYTAARSRFNDAHFLPGVLSPSNIIDALSRGFNVMHLFPAELFNSFELIKLYQEIFPKAKFMVSGPIESKLMLKYLLFPNVVGVGLNYLIKDLDFARADSLTLLSERITEILALADSVLVL